ncbi:MAG: hypothetical protein K2I81_01850 [Alphaproteobacteria bacterium]|nr:hypothetical protein [Alphaproteobacteria bacterium]
MKKLILICSIAAYVGPASAKCTITNNTSAKCNKATLSCSAGKCTQTYTYASSGSQSCSCTGKCSEETFPTGWGPDSCYCVHESN